MNNSENLLRLLLKKQSVDERIYAVLRETMGIIAKDGSFKDENTVQAFNGCLDIELPFADYPEYQKTAEINRKLLRLTACSVLDDTKAGKRKLGDFLSEDKSTSNGGDVAYLKNTLSDKAYKLFSKYLLSAQSAYMSDFNSVCEAVYDGKADYCILPIENSTDGRLGGFYSLISKYELFVCLCADIVSNDGNMRTRFALCKKNASLVQYHKKNGLYYTELIVTPSEENSMSDILFYADFFGVHTVKTDCVPTPYSDGEYNMYVTFSADEKKLVKLFLFFATEQIRYSTVGIYTLIK